MDKYTFNTSGDELLELAMVVLSNICVSPWMFVNGSRTNFGSLVDTSETFRSRIYSNQQDFHRMLDRLSRGERDIIEDVQKIIEMFQNTDDIEGQKKLLNIIKGIDKSKIVGNKTNLDLHMSKVYHGFLYKNGRASSGFRMNNTEINKYLLIHVLEVINPEVEQDFKVLVDNAKSLGVPDEDIEKIYKMLKHKYSGAIFIQKGVIEFSDSPFDTDRRLKTMEKSFAPVQERLDIKKQRAQQAQSATVQPQTSEEYEPKTLEEALELIRQLRAENGSLKKRNAVLDGIIKASQLQNQDGGNAYVPQELVLTI